MGRPPSTDRKEVVTLRLRQSVIDTYKAAGDDWRSRMEAAIEVPLAPSTTPKLKSGPVAPRGPPKLAEPEGGRVAIPFGPKAFAPGDLAKKPKR